uniref:Uncharacterized protein n=1 Tax=Romanomermis culicivorax TaxID=13658 RepID=A0A915I4V3_ROMCU
MGVVNPQAAWALKCNRHGTCPISNCTCSVTQWSHWSPCKELMCTDKPRNRTRSRKQNSARPGDAIWSLKNNINDNNKEHLKSYYQRMIQKSLIFKPNIKENSYQLRVAVSHVKVVPNTDVCSPRQIHHVVVTTFINQVIRRDVQEM